MKLSAKRFELETAGAPTSMFLVTRGEIAMIVPMTTRATIPQRRSFQLKAPNTIQMAGINRR